MAYEDYRPNGGRVLTSDGSEFQFGDMLKHMQQSNIAYQVLNGGAATLSAKFTVPGESTYYLSLTVPEGREFYLWQRDLELTEGDYDVDVCTADSFTAGATANTTNTPLDSDSESSIQTVQTYGVTNVVNPVVIEYGILDTGTGQGNSRAGGAVGAQGVFKRYTGSILLRITKLNTGDKRAVIKLIGWEEAIA